MKNSKLVKVQPFALSLILFLVGSASLSSCASSQKGTDWSFIDNLSKADCSETVPYNELMKLGDSDLNGKCITFICDVFVAKTSDSVQCWYDEKTGDSTIVWAMTESSRSELKSVLKDEVHIMQAVVWGNTEGTNGFGGQMTIPELILVSSTFQYSSE